MPDESLVFCTDLVADRQLLTADVSSLRPPCLNQRPDPIRLYGGIKDQVESDDVGRRVYIYLLVGVVILNVDRYHYIAYNILLLMNSNCFLLRCCFYCFA